MAQRLDILYVNFGIDGSAAMAPEKSVRTRKAQLPKARKQKRKVIYIDPVAAVALVVAVWMMVMMAVGLVQYRAAQAEHAVMENYVQQLAEKNTQLKDEFHSGYDIEKIEKMALALGMVPKEEVPDREIAVSVPQPEPEPTFWENIGTFLAGLFA